MEIEEFEKNIKFKHKIDCLKEDRYYVKHIKGQDTIPIKLYTDEQKEKLQELLSEFTEERIEYYKKQYKKIDNSIDTELACLKRQSKDLDLFLFKLQNETKTYYPYDTEMKLKFIGFITQQLEEISKRIEEIIKNI